MFRTTLKNLSARKLRLLTTSFAVLLGVAFMQAVQIGLERPLDRGGFAGHSFLPVQATFAVAALRLSGVMCSDVIRLRSFLSTRKRKPWNVKLCPASGIERAS